MSALRCDIFSIIVLVARPKSFGFGLVSDSWRLGLATKPNPNNLDLTQFSYPSHLDQAWFPDPSILGLYYFLFDNSANNMSSVPAKLKKKRRVRRCVAHHTQISAITVARKSGQLVFFFQKPIFKPFSIQDTQKITLVTF